VGNTFEETIESDKDVLLMMYGDYSWCEHCKIYAPEYELIAKKFQKASKITIAQMNFGHNDIEDAKARGIAPKGFPELLLFRAGTRLNPHRYMPVPVLEIRRGIPSLALTSCSILTFARHARTSAA
jgi:thiol-disulfide isomerase/thioredoxin